MVRDTTIIVLCMAGSRKLRKDMQIYNAELTRQTVSHCTSFMTLSVKFHFDICDDIKMLSRLRMSLIWFHNVHKFIYMYMFNHYLDLCTTTSWQCKLCHYMFTKFLLLNVCPLLKLGYFVVLPVLLTFLSNSHATFSTVNSLGAWVLTWLGMVLSRYLVLWMPNQKDLTYCLTSKFTPRGTFVRRKNKYTGFLKIACARAA